MPTQAEQPRIIALLRLASEAGQAALYDRLRATGHTQLRPSHFRLLRFPGPDGVRPSALAERVAMSKQAINPLINDLEDWGYIKRVPEPRDGRGRVLRLTPRGRALLKTIRQLHAAIESDWRSRLGRERFETVRDALAELAEADNAKTRHRRDRIASP